MHIQQTTQALGTLSPTDLMGTVERYIEKADRALDAIPEIQQNTDTIQKWLPWAVAALALVGVGLVAVATSK